MTPDQVEARQAIEALRSGVPGSYSVRALGTTQTAVDEQFRAALEAAETDAAGAAPVAAKASFGHGKSHLLAYMRDKALQRGFVTSTVVVSPETPMGNAKAVLQEVGRNATALDHTGEAYREMAARSHTDTDRWGALRRWARDAGVNPRFEAMLYLYEEERVDLEFRTQVLNDLQGMPLAKTEITKRLRAHKQTAGWDLKGGPRNDALAHDRIRVLARLARAFDAPGLVVLFDEVERLATFSFRQRLAAYEEIAWWVEQSRLQGSALVTVWMCNQGILDTVLKADRAKLGLIGGLAPDGTSESPALDGADFLRSGFAPLVDLSSEQLQSTQFKVASLYKAAYGLARVAEAPVGGRLSVRSEIRRWIATWDLERIYPGYAPTVTETAMEFDTSEVDDSVLEFDAGGGGE
ncbi:MAG: DUF2791 family P-loop domain-containing protein [Armatimonadetes bacterium]|nr:DUF2791 family P-loop domain-containing protein [Armatimonadota bacterium]